MAKAVAKKTPAIRMISLVVRSDLLARVDSIAAADHRSRAGQISAVLERFADDWEAVQEGEASKGRAA